MKLVFVQTATELGGSERVILSLLSAPQVRPHAVLALCADAPGYVGKAARELGIDTVLVGGLRLRYPGQILDVVRRICALADKTNADAICASGTHPQVIASLAAQVTGKPSVFLANMIYSDDVSVTSHTDQLSLHMYMSLAYGNSTPSQEAMRKIRPDVPCDLLFPGTELGLVADADVDAVRRELGIEKGATVVGVFGRLQRWKGQDIFVEAAGLLDKNIHFLVVGGSTFDLEPEFAEGLKRRAAELGLSQRMHFTGFRDDVPTCMRLCDVVCHTSRQVEPFGVVIIEAMAQERPVIATRGGGPEDIIVDGACGRLIAAEDPALLADTISSLLQDSKLRESMGKKAAERVERLFSVDAMAGHFMKTIREFLS